MKVVSEYTRTRYGMEVGGYGERWNKEKAAPGLNKITQHLVLYLYEVC